ncbi:hypothetical protein GCM10010492_66660 [Saccharothrix mutabilis subsp. mutabilis]|uniref:Uncharacterized protein n=1 Tax=Saccharothrix mutabilis subsp. mutabilis TaxID=66855 RepID=A0ABP3E9R6_9PSEU
MTGTDAAGRRLRVTASIDVEVTDPAALAQAALRRLDQNDYLDEDRTDALDEVRAAAERDGVRGDVVAALLELVDPYRIVDVNGVEVSGSECDVDEVDGDCHRLLSGSDFATIFPVCGGKPDCEDCASDHLTPRTAAVLWSMAQLLADQAYDDVIWRFRIVRMATPLSRWWRRVAPPRRWSSNRCCGRGPSRRG